MAKDKDLLFQPAQMQKSPACGDYRQGACYTESARKKTSEVYFKIGESKKFVFLATPHCNTVGSNMGRYESCQRSGSMMSCDTSYYMGHCPGGQ